MNYYPVVQVGCLCRLSLKACLHPWAYLSFSPSLSLSAKYPLVYDYICHCSDFQALSPSVFSCSLFPAFYLFVSVGGEYLVLTLTRCGFSEKHLKDLKSKSQDLFCVCQFSNHFNAQHVPAYCRYVNQSIISRLCVFLCHILLKKSPINKRVNTDWASARRCSFLFLIWWAVIMTWAQAQHVQQANPTFESRHRQLLSSLAFQKGITPALFSLKRIGVDHINQVWYLRFRIWRITTVLSKLDGNNQPAMFTINSKCIVRIKIAPNLRLHFLSNRLAVCYVDWTDGFRDMPVADRQIPCFTVM